MKTVIQLSMVLTALFALSACSNENKETKTETFQNPVDTYMDSRVNTIENAKAAVAESNKKTKEQEDAIKDLLK